MSDFASRRTVMVDTQIRPADVTKYPIIDAMLSVPREVYIPAPLREAAYVGENVYIGRNRFLLEPRTLAKLLDALDIGADDLVLDIGAGLGYSTAVIARLAEAVVGIEQDEEFAAEAQDLLAAEGVDNAVIVKGDFAEGSPKHGPFDVIILEGAVEDVPEEILAQLKDGGRIGCLFMERALGVCRIGYKIDGEMTWRYAFNASAPVLPGFAAERGFLF